MSTLTSGLPFVNIGDLTDLDFTSLVLMPVTIVLVVVALRVLLQAFALVIRVLLAMAALVAMAAFILAALVAVAAAASV